MFDETGIVEYELERMRKRRPETNIDDTPSRKLSFGKIILLLFLGILIFRAILEIISILN